MLTPPTTSRVGAAELFEEDAGGALLGGGEGGAQVLGLVVGLEQPPQDADAAREQVEPVAPSRSLSCAVCRICPRSDPAVQGQHVGLVAGRSCAAVAWGHCLFLQGDATGKRDQGQGQRIEVPRA